MTIGAKMNDPAQHMPLNAYGRPRDLTLANWDRPPYNRWSFQHMREIVPTASIEAGRAMELEVDGSVADLIDTEVTDHKGERVSAGTLVEGSHTDGFLVIHRGRIVCERYFNGMQPDTLHLVQSISKSVVATLAGILGGRGEFPLDRTVAAYVPEFAASAYHDATIRHLLDMASGVDFPEDITDPVSGVGLMDIAVGWKPVPPGDTNPRTVRDLIASLRKTVRPHGAQFDYRSMETEVLGCCIEAATKRRLCDLISEFIWQPMGAEHEANLGVDPEGYAIADGGLSASLRDLGRFGLIYARNGFLNGLQIVPQAWVEQSRIGDATMFTEKQKQDRPHGAYRNKFWIEHVDRPVILALGIYGQMIYIDHSKDFVGVLLSSWPDVLNPDLRIDMQNMMRALADRLTASNVPKF